MSIEENTQTIFSEIEQIYEETSETDTIEEERIVLAIKELEDYCSAVAPQSKIQNIKEEIKQYMFDLLKIYQINVKKEKEINKKATNILNICQDMEDKFNNTRYLNENLDIYAYK